MSHALLLALLLAQAPPPAAPPEILASVRIQGNVATPDDEMLRLAGLEIGMRLGPDIVDQTAERLRAAKRFEHVEVLKRYASIDNPSLILLVLLVDEGQVSIQTTGDPAHPTRVVKKRGRDLQLMPVFGSEDGYGVTYGARVSRSHLLGSDARLSLPATWGGEKRIAAEFDTRFDRLVPSRLSSGLSWSEKTNPYYRDDDERQAVWMRAEQELRPFLRGGASVGWQHVSFLGEDDHFVQAGLDVQLDTRLDPWLPRNAVYVRAAWDRLVFGGAPSADRFQVDARGYLRALGPTVLVIRAVRYGSAGPLPDYLKPLLGGAANLRGFAAGTAAGDSLAAGSIELRAPLTSPLRLARLGVSGFVDAGAAYDEGQRLSDQAVRRGVGGSIWLSVPLLRLEVAAAHGIGSSTRVHVTAGLFF